MPRGITQEQVNEAADTVVAAGERPTVERIRAQLGTGSPNTVTRMLDVWRQGLSERLRQTNLLPELPDEVGQAMTALWAQALHHARTQAQQELQAEREALQRATATLDTRASEQAAQLSAAEADRAKAIEAAKLATARAEAQQPLIDRLQSELKAQAHERERLVAHYHALATSESRLRQEIQAIEARAARERERWQQHVQAVENRSHAQVDQARLDLKAARSELVETRKQHREDQHAQQQRIAELTQALSRSEREASRQHGIAEALTLKLDRGSGTNKAKRKRTTKAAPPRTRRGSGR
ncbi:MAG: DNA-binding protein [Rhodanobacteraceae bacterium]|nr:MAG: DNA-binding protein [Rhodanobacteraceae bacterium]